MDFPELSNEEQTFIDQDTSLLEKVFGSPYQCPKPQTIYYEIDELNLPTKIRNTCINTDIATIELLRNAYDNSTLAACREIGPGALKIVRCKLENLDYMPPEKDEDSMYTLLWAINKLYNSIG